MKTAQKPDVADAPTPHRSSKNTRRWCLGKEGREHAPAWVPCKHDRGAKRTREPWLDYRCEKCGKELDRCWPWGHDYPGRKPSPCARGCGGKHTVQP